MDAINRHENSADTMRALVQQSHHGPGDLIVTRSRRPTPGPGDYLVRVGAAGVNFADVMQSRGTYGGGPTPPYVAGFEAAGEIVGVGPEVGFLEQRFERHQPCSLDATSPLTSRE